MRMHSENIEIEDFHLTVWNEDPHSPRLQQLALEFRGPSVDQSTRTWDLESLHRTRLLTRFAGWRNQ